MLEAIFMAANPRLWLGTVEVDAGLIDHCKRCASSCDALVKAEEARLAGSNPRLDAPIDAGLAADCLQTTRLFNNRWRHADCEHFSLQAACDQGGSVVMVSQYLRSQKIRFQDSYIDRVTAWAMRSPLTG